MATQDGKWLYKTWQDVFGPTFTLPNISAAMGWNTRTLERMMAGSKPLLPETDLQVAGCMRQLASELNAKAAELESAYTKVEEK